MWNDEHSPLISARRDALCPMEIARRASARFHTLAFALLASTLLLACRPQAPGRVPTGTSGQGTLVKGAAQPKQVRDAPYPAEPPIKLPEHAVPPRPVPDGPLVGKLTPLNPAIRVEKPRPLQAIEFSGYSNLDNPGQRRTPTGASSSGSRSRSSQRARPSTSTTPPGRTRSGPT